MTAGVVIVGGGVAGLACAVLLARQSGARQRSLPITVLEQRPPTAPGPEMGLRVLAISPASRAILASAGAWQALPPGRVAACRRMVVWQATGAPGGSGCITFDAAENGLAELNHSVEHDWLRWLLLQAASRESLIRLRTDGAPEALRITGDTAVLTLAGGAEVAAGLVIGADGADSWVRDQLGLTVSSRDYRQQAIVAHLAGERAHQDTAWQCFLPSGPVALLPLGDGRSSLVWSCDDARARSLLAADDDAFSHQLNGVMAGARGRLTLTTRRLAFPLAASHTHRYTGHRFALIGDAAHQVHPLAGQGINLGLLDAAALAETLGSHLAATAWADPGDSRALRRYERWRKGGNLLALGTMDGLDRLFSSRWPALGRLGAAGLAGVDRLPALKRLLARQAMGQDGDLPEAARRFPAADNPGAS